MLPNGRPKRLIPPGNLWRRIFHQPLCRPQPSRAISISVALAGSRTMLVVLASDRVGRFALQRLFDNQTGRELDQLILRRKLWKAVLRSMPSALHGCAVKQVV